MSITQITERETALQAEVDRLTRCAKIDALAYSMRASERNAARAELATLQAKVASVHKAKGRYHSQLAMAALYEACGLPNVKPVSGEKS